MKHHTNGRGRARVALCSIITVGILAITACSGPGESGSTGGGSEKFDVVLSNNNVSQSWRQQMMNGMQYVADTLYADTIDYEAKVSDENPSAQAASVQQIIRDRPDAILIDAISPTALNGVLQQACDAGILVINFDQTVDGLDDCVYKPVFDEESYGVDSANFMCAQLGGSGDILLDQAIAGLPSTDFQTKTIEDTLAANCPGVHIVARYESKYTPGTEVDAVSSLLASEPEVDGVVSLAYCSSVIQAFQRAGREPVPMTCVAANNNAIECDQIEAPCFMWGKPPLIGSIAMQLAVDLLQGGSSDRKPVAFAQTYYTGDPEPFEQRITAIPFEAEDNFFPNDSPELILPVTDGDLGITPQAALTGK